MLHVLSYVPRADPQRLVHIARRVWAVIIETVIHVDLTYCDPLENNPAAVWDGTETGTRQYVWHLYLPDSLLFMYLFKYLFLLICIENFALISAFFVNNNQ